ncbi:glycoside hydrolase family 97 protein [Candidatus Saccharibacteria bacterium]|nr:glycoside hydrolase family 97 protein [Candidatus Saccharibacteria bacterium]
MFKFFRWLFGRKKPLLEYKTEITSPDGRTVCEVQLKNGQVFYAVYKDKKVVIRESHLGMNLRGDNPLYNGLMLVRTLSRTMDDTWETIVGEEKFIRNNYNETALYLAESGGKKRLFTMRFRVFDTGVAFRYEIPPQPEFQRLVLADELTEFNVDANGYAWHIPAYQPDRYEYNYSRSPVYELSSSVHTPLTIETPVGYAISIHEAALYNYGSMTIKLNQKNVLAADITPLSDGAKAYVELPFNTPWRVIMVGDNALDLTTNRMILNLNEPPKEDFSWVKPLKFMGIWWAMYVGEWTWAEGERHGATTEHAIEYIDACKRLGIDGLLVEGWNNGWNGDWLKNGPTNDFMHPAKGFDIERVAKYAKDNDIELVGHHETVGYIDNYEKQLDEAYQYYENYGIHYVKPGYAGAWMTIQGRKEYHHSQLGVLHYQKALELAAKHHIMLDVHEPIKGTGLERTWPNLLTREGARGQEYEGGALSPSHATILPFTRLLSGGMDYTSGIFDVTNGTKRIATTLARQLAYYVTIFSGMQMASDRPRFYETEQKEAFKFIRDVPVSWERTVPILGVIGQYYVVARQGRDTEDWFVGGVTNEESHRVRLNLDFLADGIYEAEIYRDGDDAHYRENQLSIIIETRKVGRMDNLDIFMAPGGGFAVRLKKVQ